MSISAVQAEVLECLYGYMLSKSHYRYSEKHIKKILGAKYPEARIGSAISQGVYDKALESSLSLRCGPKMKMLTFTELGRILFGVRREYTTKTDEELLTPAKVWNAFTFRGVTYNEREKHILAKSVPVGGSFIHPINETAVCERLPYNSEKLIHLRILCSADAADIGECEYLLPRVCVQVAPRPSAPGSNGREAAS
jgi:hypothetical protein